MRASGLEKHGQIRTMLKEALGMGHGDANTVAHFYLRLGEESPGAGQIVKERRGIEVGDPRWMSGRSYTRRWPSTRGVEGGGEVGFPGHVPDGAGRYLPHHDDVGDPGERTICSARRGVPDVCPTDPVAVVARRQGKL